MWIQIICYILYVLVLRYIMEGNTQKLFKPGFVYVQMYIYNMYYMDYCVQI